MVSVMGYRQKLQLSGANKAFYIADGAIEESLAEINEISFAAEATANNHINEVFSFSEDSIFEALKKGKLDGTFLASTEWVLFLQKLESDLRNDVITEEETMEHIELGLRCEFLVEYYKSILNMSKTSLTYRLLNDDSDYLGSLGDIESYISNAIEFDSISEFALSNTHLETLSSIDIATFVTNEEGFESTTNNPKMKLVNSTFTENDGVHVVLRTNGAYNDHNKAVEVEVKIIVPTYHYVFTTSQGNKTIYNNELLDYTLTAGKDLLVTGGDVNITGDVNVYGTFPEKDVISQKEVGGILIGYKNENGNFLNNDPSDFLFNNFLDLDGNLKVSGNLYTRSNVKIYNSGNDLHVLGDLGANEFRTDRYNDAMASTDIKIEGNMYLFEDLVLRGNEMNTNIYVGDNTSDKGELYLMMSIGGSEYNSGDMSGSIIISEDIVDSVDVSVNKVFISGVSFAGISRMVGGNREYFMTGESISVENKYMSFYQSSYASKWDYKGKVGTSNDIEYFYGFNDKGQPVDVEGNVVSDGTYYMEATGSLAPIDLKVDAFIEGDAVGKLNSGAVQVDDVDKEMLTLRSYENEGDYKKKNYAYGVIIGSTNFDKLGIFNPDYAMSMVDYHDEQLKKR